MSTCKVPAVSVNLLSELMFHKCVHCEKCFVCHHCLSARGHLRDTFLRPRSIKKLMDDPEDRVDDILDAILEHQIGDEPPRYILVGPNNEILESVPYLRRTVPVPPFEGGNSTTDRTAQKLPLLLPKPTDPLSAVQRNLKLLWQSKNQKPADFSSAVQQNLQLLSSKSPNPKKIVIGINPILNLPSTTQQQTDVVPSTLDPKTSFIPSKLDPKTGVVPSKLGPKTGVVPSKLGTKTGVVPSRIGPKSGVVSSKLDPKTGVVRKKIGPKSVVVVRSTTDQQRVEEPICELIDMESDSQEDVDETPKVFECENCEKTFTTEKDLIMHDIYHSVEVVHKCKICDLTFKYSYQLIKHNLQHGNTNLTCKYCQYKCSSELELIKHIAEHGPKKFQCEICAKKFKSNFLLIKHFRVHTDERPFECQRCPKKFKSKSQLKRHNWIHDGVIRFNCIVCEKGFRESCNLKTHLLKHHNIADMNDTQDQEEDTSGDYYTD